MTDGSFERFVHEHHASLFRTAVLMTGNPDTAQDLVQTALARVYARWSRIRDQEPAAYARRIVVNAHRDVWRRNRGPEHLVPETPEPAASPDITGRVVERDSVVRALSALTARERRVRRARRTRRSLARRGCVLAAAVVAAIVVGAAVLFSHRVSCRSAASRPWPPPRTSSTPSRPDARPCRS